MVCLSSTAPRESSLALCYPPGPRRDAASGSEPRCERNARGALVHDTGAAHVPPSHDPHVTPPQRCVPLPAAHDHRAERAWRMGSLANTPMTPRSIRVRLALPCATLHPRCTCRGDSRPCVRRALCTRTTAWRSSSPCASRRPWRVPSRLTPNPPPLHRLLVVRQPRSLALNVYTMCRAGAEAPRTNGRHLLSASEPW